MYALFGVFVYVCSWILHTFILIDKTAPLQNIDGMHQTQKAANVDQVACYGVLRRKNLSDSEESRCRGKSSVVTKLVATCKKQATRKHRRI